MTASAKTVGGLKNTDIEVTLEDQNKINKFARLNQRVEEIRSVLKRKRKTLQDLSDASDEILLQADDLPNVALLIGEAFIMYNPDEAQNEMERLKVENESDVATLSKNENEIKDEMARLKVDLYAKFGANINLEADDEA